MKVFLVRHGDSKELEGKQQITAKGREESAKNALVLKQLHPTVTAVYYSTKLRAKQTAEIFHELLCHHYPLEEKKGLDPMDNPEMIMHELNQLQENIMFVSHLPFLEKLTASLLYGEEDHSLPFTFENSTVLSLERTGGIWHIVGLIKH